MVEEWQGKVGLFNLLVWRSAENGVLCFYFTNNPKSQVYSSPDAESGHSGGQLRLLLQAVDWKSPVIASSPLLPISKREEVHKRK